MTTGVEQSTCFPSLDSAQIAQFGLEMLEGQLDGWASCESEKFLPAKLSLFMFESQGRPGCVMLPAVGYFWLAEMEV